MTWPLVWDSAGPARDGVGRLAAGPAMGSLGRLMQHLNARAAERPDPPTPSPAGPRGAGRGRWYNIARPVAADDGTSVVEVDIYDEIGWWGTTAADFVAELREVDCDVIDLRLNSPGGDVFDGIAIYNCLVDHPADVQVTVDALAASIASVIAQAGDKVVMAPNSQMMIHDAWGVQVGNADDMREMADLLDAHSLNIASVYAQRTGVGDAAEWRDTMKAETWYSADEAVEAGLADEARQRQPRKGKVAARAHDLSKFRHAGRAAAPAPTIRPAERDETPPAPIPDGGPGADGGPSDGPVVGAAPGPATGTPAEPDPWAQLLADVPDDVFAGLGEHVAAAADPFEFDPDAFRASVGDHANNMPATPDVHLADNPDLPDFDLFLDALQEGLR